MMGKDVEEGEISDTASIEEISEEDFNIKQEDVVRVDTETKPVKFGGGDAAARVWTMQDLCDKYPNFYRGYGPRLHNFAWAQAVQNKPLNEIFVMEGEQHGAPKRSPPASSVASVNSGAAEGKYDKKEVEEVVIDDSGNEKEEGELEEGEIELDTESKDKVSEQEFFRTKLVNVDSIQEALESVVNAVDGDESFEGVCLKLENALRSLQEVMIGSNVLTKDALIQRAFSAVQSVYCVYCSMNHTMKEQSKEILLRLLYLINSQEPFFASQQIKEVDDMVASLGTRASDKEKDMVASLANVGKDSNLVAKNVANLSLKNVVPLFGDYLKQNKPLEASRPGASSYRSRVLLPLLDPHKVHDVDSLPSPTRETTPSIPVHRPLLVGSDTVKSGPIAAKLAHNTEVHKSPHYSTDALRAFSSYQQKFGRNSVFMNNELPSPTPSEESGDGGGDTGGEISSAPIFDSLKRAIAPTLGKQPVSSQPMDMSQPMDISSGQVLTTTNNSAPGCYDFNPVVKPNPVVKKSVKSRDPRLLFVSSNTLDLSHQSASMVHNDTKLEPFDKVMNSRKQKTVEEQVLDGPAPKRQRNGSENSVDTDMVQPQIMNRNQLVDSTVCNPRTFDNGSTCLIANGIPSVSMSINEPVPVTIPSTMAALPAFLKGIAENPTKFLDMIKMGQQQKVAAEAQPKSNDTLMNTIHPPIPNSIPPINVTSSIPSGILPKPTDQSAKVRMKPRDPRRVLHGNALQRSGSLGTELKTDGPSNSCTQGSKENFNFQKQLSPPEAKPVLSQSVQQPDIIQQFTKNLKDIADFISVSQPLTSEPMVSQSPPIQQGQAKLGAELKAVASNDDDKRTETSVGPEAGPLGARPQNTWGDVEHLFEGYDNQQKAAIQRERARRLEEQKKMFSARKLCLVLDLDHTLLNSAKFHEVDPLHDEILRKKEEQDREKPLRHLFRFPHMGMWTKLRPGIWNFLERASKLFELHLYTMGNKLYATEMAKVLDPKGVLFAGRVISRGDDGDPLDGDERIPKSKDLEGVLGMESAVVIIDDSVRVWPHNKLNLIVVERYTYFPCSRRQFGLLGPSLLEIDHDERPEDGTLASSLGVIERMHSIFFSHQSLDDVDVRNILAAEQRKILAGCRIIFSRVFPVGEANPHLHPLWQTAEQFGAVCTKHIDDQVTHVVANSLGTDKVNWALSRGRFVVHPGWVEASALLYRRANEQDFAIKP